MNRLKITVDVSHLNKQSFFDVEKLSKKPFIASHSNLDDSKVKEGRLRNLTKEQAQIIIEREGLIGINFYNILLFITWINPHLDSVMIFKFCHRFQTIHRLYDISIYELTFL